MLSIKIASDNRRYERLLGPWCAFDLERDSKTQEIYAAAIVDNEGRIYLRHISDFIQNGDSPEKQLIEWINAELLRYPLTFGWYSTGVKSQDGTGKNSDLKVLDIACQRHDIATIVDVIIASPRKSYATIVGYGYGSDYDPEKYVHVDLCAVFQNEIIRTTCCDSLYQRAKLAEVSEALEIGEKFGDFDGLEIRTQPKAVQLKYVANDAELVIKLVKWKNYRALDVMHMIAQLTEQSFVSTCHSAATKWWSNIIANNADETFEVCPLKKLPYQGADVLTVKPAGYTKALTYVLDIASQYPTMMLKFNISPETVCCKCCKDNPDAKIPPIVLYNIDHWAENSKKHAPNCRIHYWVCRKREGLVPKILKNYRNWRFALLEEIKEKELTEDSIEHVTQFTIKILMNSCYGVFGHEFFDFADYRVAELTTAFARITLRSMKQVAEKEFKFTIIGGDTDSIFVTDVKENTDIHRFLEICKLKIPGVTIEASEKKIVRKFLQRAKKHYIAVPLNPKYKIEQKGVEGKKSDRPKLFRNLQKQFGIELADDDIDHSAIFREAHKAILEGTINRKLLLIQKALHKNPADYKPNIGMKRLGLEQNASIGDAIKYYYGPDGKEHTNPAIISRAKYLEDLESTFGWQLEYAGYDWNNDIKRTISLSSLPRQGESDSD
jgi:DNA polymerase elongation subunit (family B)